MSEPEADQWICTKCGYTTNSEELKNRHEAGRWMVGNDPLNHIMELHPEHN